MKLPNINKEHSTAPPTGTELTGVLTDYDNSKNTNIDSFEPEIVSPYTSATYYSDLIEIGGKPLTRFIHKVEQLIRGSFELQNFTRYLRTEMEMTSCELMKEFSSEDVHIEIHHYPFTLYDLVEIALRRRSVEELPISTLALSKEVVAMHYKGLVGLVPLSKTVHDLAHAGKVFINLKRVYGDFRLFMQTYNVGLTSDHLTLVAKLISLSDGEEGNSLNEETLLIQRSTWISGTRTLDDAVKNNLIDYTDENEDDNEDDSSPAKPTTKKTASN